MSSDNRVIHNHTSLSEVSNEQPRQQSVTQSSLCLMLQKNQEHNQGTMDSNSQKINDMLFQKQVESSHYVAGMQPPAPALSNSNINFPVKLHYMLSELEKDGLSHIVSWQPHGRCFLVHNQEQFVKEILPLWFRQTKYASFQRQLNLYGFSRFTAGRDKGGYYHKLFLRGKRSLSYRIERFKIKGHGARKPGSPETEPNFYLQDFLPPCSADDDEKDHAATPRGQQKREDDPPSEPGAFPPSSSLLLPPAAGDSALLLAALRAQPQLFARMEAPTALSDVDESQSTPITVSADEHIQRLLLSSAVAREFRGPMPPSPRLDSAAAAFAASLSRNQASARMAGGFLCPSSSALSMEAADKQLATLKLLDQVQRQHNESVRMELISRLVQRQEQQQHAAATANPFTTSFPSSAMTAPGSPSSTALLSLMKMIP